MMAHLNIGLSIKYMEKEVVNEYPGSVTVATLLTILNGIEKVAMTGSITYLVCNKCAINVLYKLNQVDW
jgi:hypothetical protein